MKITTILMLLLALVASAAEDKYEELTTKSGKTFKSVVVRTVTPSELRIMHESGMAGIKLGDLPEELQKKYGYDPEKAKEHQANEDKKLRANEQALARELAAHANQESKKEAQKEAEKQAVRLRGEIRQVTKDGLLIYAHYGNERMPVYDAGKNRPDLYKEDFALLIGHPNQNSKVDDDWFDVDAVLVGIHEYQTVLGASKRVRTFKVIKTFK